VSDETACPMSGLGPDLRTALGGIRSWVLYLVSRARRTTPGPALVRLVAAAAALGALALAVPADVLSSSELPRTAVILLPAALAVGLFPRTRWVSLVAVCAIGGWLVSTIGFGDPVHVGRVGLLASALYVMHAAAALAAVLPYDCLLASGVLFRLAVRVCGVLGVSLVVGLGGMSFAGQLPQARSVVGPIVGSIVAASLAGLLAWHLRRR